MKTALTVRRPPCGVPSLTPSLLWFMNVVGAAVVGVRSAAAPALIGGVSGEPQGSFLVFVLEAVFRSSLDHICEKECV